ncbi:MAG TPA: hydrogenase maturation protease [Solirubrobacteraceae bacterium]|nr:hydrogenase maturation protease [Solirubrobacteraceae bacterium]
MAEQRAVVVIGIGNELRGDDCAGLEVARRVRARAGPRIDVFEARGDQLSLLQAWDGCRAAVLIDAVHSGAAPGAVHRLDLGGAPLDSAISRHATTHSVSPLDAVELARALHRLPPQVVLYAIEGEDFALGASVSASVRCVLDSVARAVARECERVLAPSG